MSSEQLLKQRLKPMSLNDNINNKLVINKAFFGKENCLKLTLNRHGECYIHFGMLDKKTNSWSWKKLKFNDAELGSMLLVLAGKKKSVAFFHSYKNTDTQIWVNRDKDFVFFKIKEMSKSLSVGEQEVLRVLLEYMILRMSINL